MEDRKTGLTERERIELIKANEKAAAWLMLESRAEYERAMARHKRKTALGNAMICIACTAVMFLWIVFVAWISTQLGLP